MAKSIQLYLHVHQPWRLREYTAFDTGANHNYFDAPASSAINNANILRKVANKSYLPTNRLLTELLMKYTVIYDDKDQFIASLQGEQNRSNVRYDQIPKHTIQAFAL